MRTLLLAMCALSACHAAGQTAPTLEARSVREAKRCAISRVSRVGAQLEVTVSSANTFPVLNELPALQIGSAESRQSRYPDSGDTQSLLFLWPAADLAAIPSGAPVLVFYGEPTGPQRFECLPFDKRLLPPA